MFIQLTGSDAQLIRDALAEGMANCGDDPECAWAEPLAIIEAAIADADVKVE